MGRLSQRRMIVIVETLSKKSRNVGTIFALLKKRMPVNRGTRLYQLSNSGQTLFWTMAPLQFFMFPKSSMVSGWKLEILLEFHLYSGLISRRLSKNFFAYFVPLFNKERDKSFFSFLFLLSPFFSLSLLPVSLPISS